MDPSSRSTSAVHRFRSSETRQPLHPREQLLLWIAGTHLVFVPWALGGMPWWSQWTSFALSALAFLVAVFPRTYREALTAGASFRLYPFSRLVRFPFFWLGLVYFAFIAIQMANPAWVYMTKDRSWWVESIEHITWLPHGVADTPFRPMNAWRTLLIHGSVWLLVCALWIGLTRRRSTRLLLYVIAINGVALAIVAILQRLTNTRELLWLWPAPSSYHVATFVYKNHAGAYFSAIAALLAGFAWWHADRASRRLDKSHPGLLFVFLIVVVSVALLFTYARASTALGVAYLVVAGIGYVVYAAFRHRGGPPPFVTALTVLIAMGFLALSAYSLNIERVWEKFGRLFEEDRTLSIENRQLAARATFDMGRDSPVFGHGVAAYRYVFPWYQRTYPQIYATTVVVKKQTVERRLYWEHAHNDYAELFAEMGWAGVAMAGALLGCIAAAMRRGAILSHPPHLIMLGSFLVVALAALADFPFRNPAILTTTAVLVALVLQWGLMDRSRRA